MDNKIRAILFDFDGVLADTMNDNFLAWEKAFLDYNIKIQKEDYFPLEGMKLIKIAETIGNKFELSKEEFPRIVELKNKYYLRDHQLIFYEGVDELQKILYEKKVPTAIVSSSPKQKLEKTVPKIFLDKFDVIISGDDTIKGKPDPEPYLTAANKLKCSNNECVVIENAPLGIKSAKKAGMYCIAICSTLEKSFLMESDEIIDKFVDVKNINIIKNLIESEK